MALDVDVIANYVKMYECRAVTEADLTQGRPLVCVDPHGRKFRDNLSFKPEIGATFQVVLDPDSVNHQPECNNRQYGMAFNHGIFFDLKRRIDGPEILYGPGAGTLSASLDSLYVASEKMLVHLLGSMPWVNKSGDEF